jgi:hypothetical protein
MFLNLVGRGIVAELQAHAGVFQLELFSRKCFGHCYPMTAPSAVQDSHDLVMQDLRHLLVAEVVVWELR